jgi:hypothetical protein
MPAQIVKDAVRVDDACPPTLRRVVESWKQGASTSTELEEASYIAALDGLPDYAPCLFPTEPQAVRTYRQLTSDERRRWTGEEKRQHMSQFETFYAAESAIRARNASNRRWLKDVLRWAEAKPLPTSALSRLHLAMQDHDLPAETDSVLV